MSTGPGELGEHTAPTGSGRPGEPAGPPHPGSAEPSVHGPAGQARRPTAAPSSFLPERPDRRLGDGAAVHAVLPVDPPARRPADPLGPPRPSDDGPRGTAPQPSTQEREHVAAHPRRTAAPLLGWGPAAPRPHGPLDEPPAPTRGGPVYRAAIDPPAVPGESPAPAWHESVEEVVPPEIASTFRSALGIELGHVPVRRGRAVSRQARALGARAFTERGEVFLPDEAGPLQDRETRALLAHELMHAAQQRTLGPDLPTEESAAGRRLEADAIATERWIRGDGGPPSELVHRPRPESALADQVRRLAAEVGAGATVQRAEPLVEDAPAQQAQPAPAADPGLSWSPQSGFTQGPGDSGTVPPAAEPPPPPPPTPIGRTVVATPSDPDGARVLTTLRQLGDELTELRERDREPAPDLDDPGTLDGLAEKLYRYIRGRLRAELIVDRERSGLLADLR